MSETSSDSTSTEKKTKKSLPRYRGHSRLAKSGNTGSLNIPTEMMAVLTEGLLFKPELTKDGILFKIVDEDKIVADEKTVPAWVKKVSTAAPASTVQVGNTTTEMTEDEFEALVDGTDENAENDEPPVTDDDTPF